MFLFFLCQGVSAAEVLLESGERIRARFVVLATGVSALFVFFFCCYFQKVLIDVWRTHSHRHI